jgi:hypothetical protein
VGPPGHFAVALAAKPAVSRVPLWLLLLATEVLDLLAFAFFAIGIERPAPNPMLAWSHGLFMSVIWSIVSAGVIFLVLRNTRASMVFGLLVFSHWVLDFVSHSRDLPIFFNGSPSVGLGLESSLPVGILTEFSMFAAGLTIYLVGRRKAATRVMSKRADQ